MKCWQFNYYVFKCDLNELTFSAARINAGSLFHKYGAEVENLLELDFILDAKTISGSRLEEQSIRDGVYGCRHDAR